MVATPGARPTDQQGRFRAARHTDIPWLKGFATWALRADSLGGRPLIFLRSGKERVDKKGAFFCETIFDIFKSRLTTAPKYGCPAATQFSGTRCISTSTLTSSITSYSCPSGGTANGATCTLATSVPVTVTYSCPQGQSLSGNQCIETITVVTDAKRNLTCPGGVTPSAGDCSATGRKATLTFVVNFVDAKRVVFDEPYFAPAVPLKLLARYVSKDIADLPANFAFADAGNFTYELQYKDGSRYQAPITVTTKGEWDEPEEANGVSFDPDKGIKCLIYGNSTGGQGTFGGGLDCTKLASSTKTLGGYLNIDGVDSIRSLMKELDATTAVVEYVRSPKPVFEEITLGDGMVEQRAKTSANYSSRILRYPSSAACSNKTFLNGGSWGALLQATTERFALTSPTADYIRVGAPYQSQYTSPSNAFNVSANTTETKPQLNNKAVPFYGSAAEMFVVNKSDLLGAITGFAGIKQETSGAFAITNVVPGDFRVTTTNYSAPVITATDSGSTRNILATYSNILSSSISTISYNVTIPCQGVSSAYISGNSASTAQVIAVNTGWVAASPRAYVSYVSSYVYGVVARDRPCGQWGTGRCDRYGWIPVYSNAYGADLLNRLNSKSSTIANVAVDLNQPEGSNAIVDIAQNLSPGDATIGITTINSGNPNKSGSLNTIFVSNE